MCGRFTLTSPGRALAERFGLSETPELAPRYNIAPGQDVAVVRAPAPGAARRLETRRWGLVPAWARDPGIGQRTINARAESLERRPAFRDAYRARRCLVVADGFYEWRRREGRSQPYLLRSAGGAPIAFAGLYERWRGSHGRALDSCAIVTTGPNEMVRELHDRMPVILDPARYADWLDPRPREPAELAPLLRPCPPEWLERIPVGTRVNDVANDDPECIAAVPEPPPAPEQRALF